jgi:hypothetical protein
MKTKEVFPTIYKKYRTKEKFSGFVDKLIQRVKDNNPISDNGLLDGFIIGLIHSNSGYLWIMLFTESQLPPMSDNSIQQLEQCIKWIANNEEALNKL